MNPEQMQETNPQMPDMTPDEAAASLSFATHLQDQLIPRQPQEEAVSEQPTEQPEQVDPEGLKEEIMKDVKETIKQEISGIKDMIKEALSEEDDKEE